jgi:hypothetical protein
MNSKKRIFIFPKEQWWGRVGYESVIHPKDQSSNLGTDRKYYLFLFVSHLNPNL